jgi:hypothetical protein
VLVTVAVFAAVLFASAGAAGKIRFTRAKPLPSSPPKGELPGPEPSVAFDPGGRYAYVSAPTGGDDGGVSFWISRNGGRTWPVAKSLGSKLGGGDSDVSVGPDGTVFVADLELIANALCRSHDHGKHFDAGCDTGIASDQEGFDSDREWVTPDPGDRNIVYFTYHDLAAELPLVYKSTSGGQPLSFTPCGSVLAPGSDAAANFGPGGTDVGKPAVSPDGSIYVPITEPINPGTPLDPYAAFYVAIASGGCGPTTIFDDKTIWQNANADLANIFSYIVQDPGGHLYALATGKTGTDGDHVGTYLWVSRSHGTTWSKPIRVDPPKMKASAMATIAPGNRRGQIAIGYYGTKTTKTLADTKNVWRYYVATSRNGGRTFRRARITRKPIHYGAICTTGILCTAGRNLADFSSIGVNPRTGCALAVVAGDPYDKKTPDETPAAAYTARQKRGCFR